MTTTWGEMFLASCVLIPEMLPDTLQNTGHPPSARSNLASKSVGPRSGYTVLDKFHLLELFWGDGGEGCLWILSVYSWDMTCCFKGALRERDVISSVERVEPRLKPEAGSLNYYNSQSSHGFSSGGQEADGRLPRPPAGPGWQSHNDRQVMNPMSQRITSEKFK